VFGVSAVLEYTHPVFACLPPYRGTVLGQHLQIGCAFPGQLTAEKDNANPAGSINNNNEYD
jgi:hypothetical protein